jgi:hypothetical protein
VISVLITFDFYIILISLLRDQAKITNYNTNKFTNKSQLVTTLSHRQIKIRKQTQNYNISRTGKFSVTVREKKVGIEAERPTYSSC